MTQFSVSKNGCEMVWFRRGDLQKKKSPFELGNCSAVIMRQIRNPRREQDSVCYAAHCWHADKYGQQNGRKIASSTELFCMLNEAAGPVERSRV